MPSYINTNSAFGESGPFEAESREALATEMQPTFDAWANDAESRASADDVEFDRSAWMDATRKQFIQALNED